MYLDISFKKIAFILSVTMVLAISVYLTNGMKLRFFGTTPFFYTITTFGKYVLNSAFATVQKGSQNLSAVIFSRDETDIQTRAIPVLTYHRVVNTTNDQNNVSIASFRDQMSKLKAAGWQTVTLQEFEDFTAGKIQLPEKSFLLTFDDGAKESFYPVDPILQMYDYHAVIFVIAQSSQTPESTYYLSPQELTWILQTGRWDIGSHSFDGHRPYATDAQGDKGIFFADRLWLPDQNRLETPEEFATRVHSDLLNAKTSLEETYHVPVNSFAFPLGNETGIEGVANYADGPSITEAQARSIYSLGFLQINNQEFFENFPAFTGASTNISTETDRLLATNFIVRRIHVDHDWDGNRLLSILENGRAKHLPFEDDFSDDKGWIIAWGAIDLGRNNLSLKASPDLSSTETFLDGSATWDNYSFDAAVNWTGGDVFVLGDVINSKTYDACIFAPGSVRIQSVVNGEAKTLKEVKSPQINYGNLARVGIRVHDAVIECAWNFNSVVETYGRTHAGGIGLQIWNEQLGTASLQVSSIIARSYSATGSGETTTQ